MISRNNIKNKNFWNLILGQSLFTIGNSIFEITLLYIIAEEYRASSSILGTFGIIAILPSMFLALFVPSLTDIKNQKNILITLQIIAIFLLAVETFLLYKHFNLMLIGFIQFILQLTFTISNSIEIGYIPIILYEDQTEIDKTINISYATDSTLVILTGLISSSVILLIGTKVLLLSSIFFPAIGLAFYLKINYSNPKLLETVSSSKTHLSSPIMEYISIFKDEFYNYSHTLPAFYIILSEAILGGLTGLLLQLLPITMKELGLAIALFPMVSSVQKCGDIFGGLFAPLIKLNAHLFFVFDYIITGICFIMIGIQSIPNIIKLLLLIIASLSAGLSGNIFEKLMYRSFSSQKMSSMHALVTSTFSTFSLISYFSSFLSISTLFIWIGTGIVSLIIGISLYLYGSTHREIINQLKLN